MTLTNSRVVPLHHPDRFFIGGEWVVPSSGEMINVINPSTEELYFRIAEAKEADVQRAVAAARLAFDAGPWPNLTHGQRAEYLRAIAAAIEERGDDLSRLWTSEIGILHSASRAAASGYAAVFERCATMADDFPFLERHQTTSGGKVGLLVREPVGVVGAIVPWNAPLALIAQKTAPALLAGCTLVMKLSPEAPGEGYVVAEIAEQIGLPPGVINVLTADRPVSETLVRDARVDKITFTGSTATGRKIASLCGDRIARCTLELGGKSAAVILDDYDIATAAATISARAIFNTGQTCASLTRIIVSRDRHDDLVDALSKPFSNVRIGDPYDTATEMGPLGMSRQRDRVEHYIAKGREEGATLATGGGRPAGLDRGYFIEPTVFANVDNHSTIAREEIFGPVLSVIAANDERHAVHIANDSIYGLGAAVFTNDADRAFDLARRIRSGTVSHNMQRSDFGIAAGGFKQSGIGREGGREGLLPFLETKTVILDAEPTSVHIPQL